VPLHFREGELALILLALLESEAALEQVNLSIGNLSPDKIVFDKEGFLRVTCPLSSPQ
jgi:hypothetical protein